MFTAARGGRPGGARARRNPHVAEVQHEHRGGVLLARGRSMRRRPPGTRTQGSAWSAYARRGARYADDLATSGAPRRRCSPPAPSSSSSRRARSASTTRSRRTLTRSSTSSTEASSPTTSAIDPRIRKVTIRDLPHMTVGHRRLRRAKIFARPISACARACKETRQGSKIPFAASYIGRKYSSGQLLAAPVRHRVHPIGPSFHAAPLNHGSTLRQYAVSCGTN